MLHRNINRLTQVSGPRVTRNTSRLTQVSGVRVRGYREDSDQTDPSVRWCNHQILENKGWRITLQGKFSKCSAETFEKRLIVRLIKRVRKCFTFLISV